MDLNVSITWHNFKESIIVIFPDNYSFILHKGDFITYETREPDGVIIEDFTGDDLSGPIGVIYRPWRTSDNRWASMALSIAHGNSRHIICYPTGFLHYGQHINWRSVRVINEQKPLIEL
jgi:hypothetical protein